MPRAPSPRLEGQVLQRALSATLARLATRGDHRQVELERGKFNRAIKNFVFAWLQPNSLPALETAFERLRPKATVKHWHWRTTCRGSRAQRRRGSGSSRERRPRQVSLHDASLIVWSGENMGLAARRGGVSRSRLRNRRASTPQAWPRNTVGQRARSATARSVSFWPTRQ